MAEPIIATKRAIEEIYDSAAARYDRTGPSFFWRFGARLVELLAIAPGACVLDVGTGTGAVLIPAAQRVGTRGRVVGVDLSSGMLQEAERAARAAGLANFELHKMDAERLEFPDASFDVASCGFTLSFLPAMDVALREMRRVLKPGGCIGVTLWGKAPFHPAWKMLADSVRAYGVEVRMPQKIAYAPEEIQALLAAAGFIGIETRSETSDIVYASEEDWWAFQLTMGSRAAIYRMDDETRARLKEEYLAKLRPLFRADGLHLPAPVVYALARNRM